jgi:acyl-CoA synthetase (NDP forming)
MTIDLGPLLRPASVALVGASPRGTPAEVLGNLRRTGFAGRLVAVNPGRSEVDGLPCHPSLVAAKGDGGEPVDVAAIMVKAARVPDALRDCIAAGARSVVVFADGVSEADPGGPDLQREMAAQARAAGLPLLGPNCMGYLSPALGTALYIDRISRLPRAGTVGLVTQSGSVGVAGINQTGTLGLSTMVSVGNEAVIGIADAVDWLSRDGVTRAIAVFAEGFRDGRAFLAAAGRARGRGVPVVVCKTGRSPNAARAARSHTGAMAHDQRVVRAVLEAHGIAVVDDLDEMFAAAELAATGRRFGRRLAGITLSGGHVGLLHDVAAATGVVFPAPEPATHRAIEGALGVPRAVANPVDSWVNDDVVASAGRTMEALTATPEFDGFVLAIDTPANPPTSFVEMGRDLARLAAAVAARDPRPTALVATTIAADDEAVTEVLRTAGVPRLSGLRAALAAWGALSRAAGRSRPTATATAMGHALHAASEPEVYRLLAGLGIAVPRHAVCRDRDAARQAARAIGFPVVAKIVSTAITHKTDVGGVVLGIEDEAALDRAAERLLAIPGADAIMIAETVPAGIEAIVGGRVDPTFGPVVMVGMGGVLAELLDDVAVLPAPATEEEILAAVAELRLGRLIAGYRGAPARNGKALAAIASRLSRLIAGAATQDLSLEMNPVRLVGDGAIVLDGKIVGPRSVDP